MGTKLTFSRQDDGGYIVRQDGDRIGFVRQVGKLWHATDNYFIGIRRPYKSRANAVVGLRRRALLNEHNRLGIPSADDGLASTPPQTAP